MCVCVCVRVFAVTPVWILLSQSKLLCQYVLNMAKYDQNYDIRDRARFLRQLIMPANVSSSPVLSCRGNVTQNSRVVVVFADEGVSEGLKMLYLWNMSDKKS